MVFDVSLRYAELKGMSSSLCCLSDHAENCPVYLALVEMQLLSAMRLMCGSPLARAIMCAPIVTCLSVSLNWESWMFGVDMSYSLPSTLSVPVVETCIGCAFHPVVWMLMFCCVAVVGTIPVGKWRNVRSLSVAMSSPKMIANADTISALR
jgi:hypothetical protein